MEIHTILLPPNEFQLVKYGKSGNIQAPTKHFQEFSSSQWSPASEASVRHHRISLQPLSSGDGSLSLFLVQAASH